MFKRVDTVWRGPALLSFAAIGLLIPSNQAVTVVAGALTIIGGLGAIYNSILDNTIRRRLGVRGNIKLSAAGSRLVRR